MAVAEWTRSNAERRAGFVLQVIMLIKAKIHYAIVVADRSEAGRRPAASWNLAYHLAR